VRVLVVISIDDLAGEGLGLISLLERDDAAFLDRGADVRLESDGDELPEVGEVVSEGLAGEQCLLAHEVVDDGVDGGRVPASDLEGDGDEVHTQRSKLIIAFLVFAPLGRFGGGEWFAGAFPDEVLGEVVLDDDVEGGDVLRVAGDRF